MAFTPLFPTPTASGPTASAGPTPSFTPLGQLPPKPGIGAIAGNTFGLIGGALSSVADAAKSGMAQAGAGYNKAVNATNPLDLLEGSAALGAGAINTLASPLAPVMKPVGAAVNAVSDKISNIPAVQSFANSPVGEATARAAEDVANLSTIAGGVTSLTSPKVAALAGKADAAVTKVMTPTSPQNLAIDYTNKALGNTGKKTATTILSNDSKRLKGLETMYTMTKDTPIKSSDGTTFQFDPTNIKDPGEMLQAFTQAKQQIWNHVQTNLEKGSSVKPDYAPVKVELQKVIDSSGSTMQAKSHAATRLAEVNGLEKGGVGSAQEYLQQLNSRLGATFSGASDAIPNKIDAQIAHGVNDALDKGLDTVKDASVRPLKDMYSNLKAIEPDLVKMTQKVLRQTGKGIPQYINDFGNINILDAVFAHNPALFVAKGGAMKIMAKVLSGERDPLGNLSKAFQNVAEYAGGTKPPQQAPTLALPPGTRGLPSTVTSAAPINLPAKGSTNTRTTFGGPLPPRNK